MTKDELIDRLKNAHILTVKDLTETKPTELFLRLKDTVEGYLEGISSRDYEELIIALACQKLFKFYDKKNGNLKENEK